MNDHCLIAQKLILTNKQIDLSSQSFELEKLSNKEDPPSFYAIESCFFKEK
jgi:hypothetical protein